MLGLGFVALLDAALLAVVLLEIIYEEVGDEDHAEDDEGVDVGIVGHIAQDGQETEELDDPDQGDSDPLKNPSALVVPAVVQQTRAPPKHSSPCALILDLSPLLLDHILHLLDLLKLRHHFRTPTMRQLVDALHLVVARVQDGLKRRLLQLTDQLAHLARVEPLKLRFLATGLGEGEHIILAIHAVLVTVQLYHCPEKLIARQLLVIMLENEHIELKPRDHLDQQALDFVYLPLQRHLKQQRLRLHLYLYPRVLALDELEGRHSLLLYHAWKYYKRRG